MSTTVSVVNRDFTGIRVMVDSPLAFDDVLSRLHALMGKADPEFFALTKTAISQEEYARRIAERYVGESGFMLFTEFDHGDWLPKFGMNRRTTRLVLGNPLIAVTMIRHDITAGLFAPVELLVTENEDGKGTCVLYVRPSSLIVVEDNPPLLAAAQALDENVDALIDRATMA
jgi:uncharacterized protein (DUF302 family)